ncbi:BtpA/SgcQ family protein [Halobium salinum]|uniref:BtpA/SgcQ family protein n=1 Tax=Halobium salinum TaxID=1364940 RepID=A0ABD5P6P3_9EURY|nr:BtpA/SgcQ family protein [Halobium salinum]
MTDAAARDPLDFVDTDSPLVGMVHLPPLPGAPRYEGDREAVRGRAVADAETLAEGGVDAVLVENFGDAPFYPDDVPKHVVSELTAAVGAVRRAVDLPVGVNVLRNDAEAALSVAAAAGASFVRVNVHSGARVTDQGVVEGRAHETMRLRERIDAADVRVFADVDVKHSAPLSSRDSLDDAVAETVERGLADGLIVSGAGTGEAVDADRLRRVVDRRDDLGLDAPVLVGSGVTTDSVADLLSVADGAIVGTALKEDGVTTNPVDRERVVALVSAAAGR